MAAIITTGKIAIVKDLVFGWSVYTIDENNQTRWVPIDQIDDLSVLEVIYRDVHDPLVPDEFKEQMKKRIDILKQPVEVIAPQESNIPISEPVVLNLIEDYRKRLKDKEKLIDQITSCLTKKDGVYTANLEYVEIKHIEGSSDWTVTALRATTCTLVTLDTFQDVVKYILERWG